MVPALIFAALAVLLLCAATSHACSEQRQFAAGDHGSSTTFFYSLASKPIGASSVSVRTPLSQRKAALTDQINRVVLTSIDFCKSPSARRANFRWPQPIPLAEDAIRPTG